MYETYKDELKNCLIKKKICDINLIDNPDGREELSVEEAVWHMKGEHIRRYFDAANDVVRYPLYPDCNKEQALASALELQGHVLTELYKRGQSHQFYKKRTRYIQNIYSLFSTHFRFNRKKCYRFTRSH